MMFSELLLRSAKPELVHTDAMHAIKVLGRLDWDRCVPLSGVGEIELHADDVLLISDEMPLGVDGHSVSFRSPSEREDIWWFPLDQAVVDRRVRPHRIQ